jgi:hypothetical protein
MKSRRVHQLILVACVTLLIVAAGGCGQQTTPKADAEAQAPPASVQRATTSIAPKVCTEWTPDWRDKCDEVLSVPAPTAGATATNSSATSAAPVPATPEPATPAPSPGAAPQPAAPPADQAASHTLAGEVFVDSPQEFPSHPCTGGSIYPDIAVGSTVTIKDGSGKELAEGTFVKSWLTSGPQGPTLLLATTTSPTTAIYGSP